MERSLLREYEGTAADRVRQITGAQSRYQPLLPGSPLNGPVNSGVIHPP